MRENVYGAVFTEFLNHIRPIFLLLGDGHGMGKGEDGGAEAEQEVQEHNTACKSGIAR